MPRTTASKQARAYERTLQDGSCILEISRYGEVEELLKTCRGNESLRLKYTDTKW